MLNNHGKLDWNFKQLYNGCILASIAHSIMVAHYPIVAHCQSWEYSNYSLTNTSGCRGTITFSDKFCVGAFREEKSNRIEDEFMPAIEYLWNAPSNIIDTATNKTFRYLFDYDVYGELSPIITTAFWGDEKGFHINDTYDDFMEYGGFLLLRQAMDYEHAIPEWINEYRMTPRQVDLLESLYARKIANPEERIILTQEEIAAIDSEVPDGIEESKISLEELNIFWE